MTHRSERSFEDIVESWFIDEYGVENVYRQVYQPGPRWFVDLVVYLPFATLFIEIESRATEIRPGVSQCLGYAAADPRRGIPMVITPPGHLRDRKVNRLSKSSTVVIVEFDEEEERFVE